MLVSPGRLVSPRPHMPPALDFRFASTKSLDSRITFTRASSGTYFDASGVLQTAGNNVARFDHSYDGTNWDALGLLIEEQRTNICLQSEDFGTTWTVTAGTLSTNDAAAPDGNSTADKLADDASTSNFRMLQSITITASTDYTVSVFAKDVDRQYVRVALTGGGANNFGAIFDLTAGTVTDTDASGNSTFSASSITDVGGGWYRLSITGQLLQTTAFPVVGLIDTDTATDLASYTYLGDGSAAHFWGAQLEKASFPTSYIKTTTASVTRSADVASMSDVTWFNESAGTFFAEADHLSVANMNPNGIYSANDGSGAEEIRAQGTTSSRLMPIRVRDGSVDQAIINPAGQSLSDNTTFKIAGAYALNDVAGSVNGGDVSTDTSATLPSGITTFEIGDLAAANPWNGHIARITYWPRRLKNSVLQSITS